MRRLPRVCISLATWLFALLLAACGSSGSGVTAEIRTTSGLEPSSLVPLDATLRVRFDAPIDPASLNEFTATLIAVDGPGVGVPTRGAWRAAETAIEFVPELAHGEPVMTQGGLQPDTTYELTFLGGGGSAVVRGIDGVPLASTLRYSLRTWAGSEPRLVIARDAPGGPRLTRVEWTPRDAEERWLLGRSHTRAELRLEFDQPLHPGEANLLRRPTNSARGPIVLAYDDPQYGPDTWIAVDCELERNTGEGATVLLRPRGTLPSNAAVTLTVSPTLRDLLGTDNVGSFVEPVRSVVTEPAIEPRHDALVFEFAVGTELGAPDFAEVPAVIENGALRVPEVFPEVDEDVGDWSPRGLETILNTDSQTLVYASGVAKTFEGGVLHVRNLHIPAGHVVRGFGPNPLVLVVDGDAWIEGTLSADGADAPAASSVQGQFRGPGDFVPYLPPGWPTGEPWTPPDPSGPAGGAGGGRGGSVGFVRSSRPSVPGGSAPGAHGGGQGGYFGCPPCPESSAGGGGGGAVQGDPWFPFPAGPRSLFPQRNGIGGAACRGRHKGGLAGDPWFVNDAVGDDFWGRAFVPRTRTHVVGELADPLGGSGGGSGGSAGFSSCDPLSWGHFPGGAGGGGGGVLVVKVRGRLAIGERGKVSADGGDGFGFGLAYGPILGGGGGGAGGTVVLMAGRELVLQTQGETFENRDYDFAVSADGGICVSSGFRGTPKSKYPANGAPTFTAAEYDRESRGGFGGMGLVQFMVPVGSDNFDGTNTVLDDAVTILHQGVPLHGFDKQRYLGWRGFPDESGVLVDDFGFPTGTIGGMGDIRPDPVLLPVPFATNGKARARSAWLPLGALHRRQLSAPDGQPRAVIGSPTTFASHARSDGWLPHTNGELGPLANGTEVLPGLVAIDAVALDHETLGFPVLRIELVDDLPETAPDAYVGCIANLCSANGGSHGRPRVLHSTAHALFVEAWAAPGTDASHLQLHTFGADLTTVVPQSYPGLLGASVPRANARIGFAFHRAAEHALATGYDPDRHPQQVGAWLYDLGDPAVRAALRLFGPRYLQWDIVLDGEFRSVPGDQPPPAGPGSQIALRRVFLPVRF